MAEPETHSFAESAKSERGRRDGVEALSDGSASARHGAEEGLSNVVRVDVVDGFHAEIGEGECLALREGGEYFGIKVALRVDGVPTDADEVAGVNDCCGKMIVP